MMTPSKTMNEQVAWLDEHGLVVEAVMEFQPGVTDLGVVLASRKGEGLGESVYVLYDIDLGASSDPVLCRELPTASESAAYDAFKNRIGALLLAAGVLE